MSLGQEVDVEAYVGKERRTPVDPEQGNLEWNCFHDFGDRTRTGGARASLR